MGDNPISFEQYTSKTYGGGGGAPPVNRQEAVSKALWYLGCSALVVAVVLFGPYFPIPIVGFLLGLWLYSARFQETVRKMVLGYVSVLIAQVTAIFLLFGSPFHVHGQGFSGLIWGWKGFANLIVGASDAWNWIFVLESKTGLRPLDQMMARFLGHFQMKEPTYHGITLYFWSLVPLACRVGFCFLGEDQRARTRNFGILAFFLKRTNGPDEDSSRFIFPSLGTHRVSRGEAARKNHWKSDLRTWVFGAYRFDYLYSISARLDQHLFLWDKCLDACLARICGSCGKLCPWVDFGGYRRSWQSRVSVHFWKIP